MPAHVTGIMSSALVVSLCGVHGWCNLPEDKATVRRVSLDRDDARPESKFDRRATWIGSPTDGSHGVSVFLLHAAGRSFHKGFDICLDFRHTLALVVMIGVRSLGKKSESISSSSMYTALHLVLVVVITILLAVVGKSFLHQRHSDNKEAVCASTGGRGPW